MSINNQTSTIGTFRINIFSINTFLTSRLAYSFERKNAVMAITI